MMMFRYYCGNRLFEWVMTLAMLGLALEIAIWPGTIRASAFRFVLEIVSTQFLGWFFLIAGVTRIGALVANGRLPLCGPYLRALAAAGGACVWMQMDAALFMLPTVYEAPSPGIPVYFALTLGELISCYRAICDARTRSV